MSNEVLLKAAELIEKAPRLAKGVFSYQEGIPNGPISYCAIGAIQAAAVGDAAAPASAPGVDVAIEKLIGYLYPNENIPHGRQRVSVFMWNDEENRTQEQVVTALREAATS